MKKVSLMFGLVFALSFQSAFAENEPSCQLTYSTYVSNAFGDYSIQKVLWTENYAMSSDDCYSYAHRMLRRYENAYTKWSELDLTFTDRHGTVRSWAKFNKP